MSSSSQQHCRSGKYRDLMNFTKAHYDHLPFRRRKIRTDNLKISLRPELGALSRQEISDVRQKMQGLNHKSVTINGKVSKGGLHSILFDNTNNKTDKKQILGIILDARNHFARQKNRNRRYITFSSGLNESSGTFTQSESLEGGYRNFSGFRFKKQYSIFFTLILALCFFVSCGGGKSDSKVGSLYEKCYPNETCDKGLICDTENNVCIKDPDYHGDDNNNDTDNEINNNETNDQDGKPINNNDSDDVIDDNDPINHNDSDDIIDDNDPINHNDSDDIIDDNDPINHNDSDDVMDDSDVNDNDPIENNDNDNNPSESDISNGFWNSELVATKTYQETLTQDEIDDKKRRRHDKNEEACPYNYIQQPEQYDAEGNMYIVDKCEWNISEPMWLENAAPKVLFDYYGVPPPEPYRIVSMTVNYSANGGQSNMKVRVPSLVLDVNFVSQSCLSQGDTNTSIIEMTPNATDLSAECKIDGEDWAPPIETKGTKQVKYLPIGFESLCISMPNYEMDIYNDACSTTINEFVWLENVVNKLLPKKSNGLWHEYTHTIKSITRDLNTGVFYMDMTIVNGNNEQMNLHITLNNAKSCIDQCHGKEGCTSHIEPTSQDASKGCFINGVEVNGEESAQRLPMKQHNLKYKTAPRFIKPAPAVAKQHYAKNVRPNRQKWLAQNVRNFGRNGR